MASSFPDHRGTEDLRVYLDCAAIAMLMPVSYTHLTLPTICSV